jgi:hypothetical protein
VCAVAAPPMYSARSVSTEEVSSVTHLIVRTGDGAR